MYIHALRSVIVCALLFLPSVASASFVITEIMYDLEGSDTDREWVEIFNAGGAPITIKGGTGSGSWRFNDGSGNRVLTEPPEYGGRGSLTIQPGGFLVIARDPATFLSMHPGGSYTIVRAAITLNNAGATLALLNGVGEVVNSVTYDSSMGAAGDGLSLQRSESGWVAASPTPGAAYAGGSGTTTTAGSSETGQTAHATTQDKKSVIENEKTIRAHAGGSRTVFAGADSIFEGRAIGLQGEPLENARFIWTFGNGDRREGPAIWYNFPYPGTYVVVLDVVSGKYSASDRISITVVPARLVMQSVTDEYIELANSGSVEVDLGGWMLAARGQFFTFPPHTIILPREAVKISNMRTGLSPSLPSDVSLHYPNGTVATAYEYPLIVGRGSTTSQPPAANQAAAAPKASAPSVALSPQEQNLAAASTVQQGASAAAALPTPAPRSQGAAWPWFFAAAGLSVAAAGGVFFIRRKRYAGYDVEEIKE